MEAARLVTDKLCMQAILQGSLGHFPPDQVLTFFSSFGHTGTLEIVCNEKQSRVFFDTGVVVHAESSVPGAVDEILRDLFVWPAGTFRFSPEFLLPDGVKPAATDLRVVIQEGLRRATEWKSLLQLFPSEDIGLRVVDEPQTEGKISLSPDEFKILLKVGAGRTLRRLRADLQRPALQLYPIVHRLESAGLLERIATVPSADSADPAAILTVRNLDPAEIATVPRDLEAAEAPATLVNADIRTHAFSMTAPGAAPPLASAVPHIPVAPQPEPPAAPEPKSLDERETHEREASESHSDVRLVGSLTVSNGAIYELVDAVYSIGRDANCVIRINDASVSSNHARIVRGESGFVIEDLNSRNKTFVNGEVITTPHLLADSDVLRLGKVILTFKYGGSP